MELVLHIGMHKTGSTALQRALSAAATPLDQSGILYPEAGRGPQPGHAHLAWEAKSVPDKFPGGALTRALIDEIRRAEWERVIISSEELSRVPTVSYVRWAERLAESIRVDRVQVVGYVRPQWAFLESLYAERVRGGREQRSFRDYVAAFIDHPRTDYNAAFDPWSAAFGRNVSVRHYPTDVIADFWTLVSEEVAPPTFARRIGERFGVRMIEMCRVLNAQLVGHEVPRGVFMALRSCLREIVHADEPFRALSTEEAEAIMQRRLQSNARFVQTYLDGVPFPAPQRLDAPSFPVLSDEEVEAVSVLGRQVVRLVEHNPPA
jgi:hypothetical protein